MDLLGVACSLGVRIVALVPLPDSTSKFGTANTTSNDGNNAQERTQVDCIGCFGRQDDAPTEEPRTPFETYQFPKGSRQTVTLRGQRFVKRDLVKIACDVVGAAMSRGQQGSALEQLLNQDPVYIVCHAAWFLPEDTLASKGEGA